MAQSKVPLVRLNLRMHSDILERVKYWADREDESANEWIINAIEEKISRENSDYDLPTLEQARLNQLIDLIESMSRNMENLEKVTIAMSESITGLARGDNYLLGEEDGEL